MKAQTLGLTHFRRSFQAHSSNTSRRCRHAADVGRGVAWPFGAPVRSGEARGHRHPAANLGGDLAQSGTGWRDQRECVRHGVGRCRATKDLCDFARTLSKRRRDDVAVE